jgi:hypothetical protein
MVAHLAWILPPLLKVRSLYVACRGPIIQLQ